MIDVEHGAASPSGSLNSPSSKSKASSVHAPRATPFESFSTTCKCVIGSGFMALPYGFSQAGWAAGIVCLIIMGVRSYATMSVFTSAVLRVHILNCVHVTRSRMRRLHDEAVAARLDRIRQSYGAVMSPGAEDDTISIDPILSDPTGVADPEFDVVGFQQIAHAIYGYSGRKFVDGFLIAAQVGCSIAFLSLVLTNMQSVCSSYGLKVELYFVALFLIPILIALTLPRSTTYLASVSHLGNMTLIVAVGTICYYAAVNPQASFNWQHLTELPAYGSAGGVLLFFGLSAFSFTAHAEIVAVEADAQSRKIYANILPVAMITIVSLYMTVGLFAYASFEDATRSNILLNLGDDLSVNIVRTTLSATILVNFALALFPALQALDLLIIGTAPVSEVPHQFEVNEGENGGWAKSESEAESLLPQYSPPATRDSPSSGLSASELQIRRQALSSYHLKGNVIRLLTVILTAAVAVLVQNLALLFSVVGAIFGGMLCYTLPPLFWIELCKLEQRQLSTLRITVLYAEVLLGFLLIGAGIAVVMHSA